MKFSGMIIFVFFLLWSACKESDDPIPPAATAPTLTGFSPTSGGDAQFSSPTGLAIDASGNIYVADRHNHSIRRIQ